MGPYDRINLGLDSSGRPCIVNRRTLAMIKKAEKILGHKLTIVQGSYVGNDGADASANTHKGGGVVDIRSWDQPDKMATLKVLRDVGFAAYYRTPAQGFDEHFHIVAIGDHELDPQAADQVIDYRNVKNGLASHTADPNPWRPDPIPVYNYWAELPKIAISLKLARSAFIDGLDGKKSDIPSGTVKRIQRILNHKYGLNLVVDGKPGRQTFAAWRLHEKAAGRSGRPSIPDDLTLPKLVKGTRYRMVA